MTAPEIHMPSSFMEQCPSLSAVSKSKAPSSSPEDNTTMNRMHQYLIVRLQQRRQEQRARFLQMPTQLLSSQSSVLDDSSLQTKKQSNVDGALHGNEAGANKSILAIKPDTIEQEQQAVPCRTIGKTICVPCRARGMPKDHVFKTAHFEIPDSIKHGDELLCTFPACRASGVKFCFCSYCRVPVAKNKFRVRHHHFGEALSVSAASASTSATASPVAPTTASQFIFPTTSNDFDHSILRGLLGPRSDKGDSAPFSSGSTIDSIVQKVGFQALVRQSVSMPALDIDTLAILGTAKNTSLLSFSPRPQGQLLPQAYHNKIGSVSQLSSPTPISAHDMLGSYSLPKDDMIQMDKPNPNALLTFSCPARGMPADHRRTAKFVIPRNVKHGDSLTCSYPACRDSGIKFSFCVHCNIPVARRCFRMRHHHHSEDNEAAGSATIANNASHQSTSTFDNGSRYFQTSSSSHSQNTSQASKVPSPSIGFLADISDSHLRSIISPLTGSLEHPDVARPSKKRELASSFDHGSYHHVTKMPKRSDSNFNCVSVLLMKLLPKKDMSQLDSMVHETGVRRLGPLNPS